MRIVNKFVIKCRKKYPAENIFRGISYLLRIIQACPNICRRNILRLPPPLLIYALSTFSAVLPQAVSSEAESIAAVNAAAILTDDDLQHIVDLINNRPRKRLGFRTPLEVFYKFFR